MDPTSPGSLILAANKGDTLEFSETDRVVVNCELNRFFFPTHSKREEIIKIVERLNPANVILVHGEEVSKNWVGNRILEVIPGARVYSSSTLNWIQF
jgi:Cft2 family RNA processing exonuclease